MLTIINADKTEHLNSIDTDVGPKITALNNWANNTAWNEPHHVKEVCEKLIPYAIKQKNDSLLSWSYHYLAITYYNMHYCNLSIETYKKALSTEWAKKSNGANSFRAFCALNLGCNYEFLGELDQAAKYYYLSIEMNERMGIPYVAAEAKLDVASLNIKLKQYKEARQNILESIPVLKQFNDSVRLAEAYRILSTIEVANQDFNRATLSLNQALSIATKLNDTERMVKIYLDYGEALFNQNQFSEALSAFNKALSLSNPELFPATFFQSLSNLGKTQLELSQIKLAEKNLLNAHAGFSDLKATPQLLQTENILARLYVKTGNQERFQHYFDLAHAHKDSIAATEKIRSVAESEVKYQTAQKERQIELQNIKLRNRRKQVGWITTIALLLLAGLLIVLNLLRKVKAKNKNLLKRNLELSRQWEQLQSSYKLASSKKKNDLFGKIYIYVAEQKQYTNPQLTVELLASELATNVKYISKAIKENANMNFNAFVNTFRIEEAKSLLRSNEGQTLSQEAIAEQCGFNNSTTFYQKFKQITGLTPSVYRHIEE